MEDKKREEFAEKMMDLFFETMLKEDSDDRSESPERSQITREKFKLLREQHKLEHKLGSVTDNTYCGIGHILNDLFRKQNELLVWAYEECSKFLKENNLPAEEKVEQKNEKI